MGKKKKLKGVKKIDENTLEAEYEQENHLLYKMWNRIFGGNKIKKVVIKHFYINQSGSPPPPPPYGGG
jgi:hypothetical protein